MLILTRSIGQTLLIGDDIVVEVLAIHGRQVRLGITAPEAIAVLRSELVSRQADATLLDPQMRKRRREQQRS
ncbi:MAG TPA: carbon storage regulator [Haliea salexigens]|uniref:Translational regulator CsrA n=2 Tax=Haliea TaxID=475794 RepID=A0A3C1KP83_9GAMM|nr:carbon storage regulator [Haliea sp.]MAD65351.1 carbon storage regulator [Haliea sp.]HAN28509.1 carbon storage regulator [Haliea salexigens]HBX74246.1 carbon storage regulator [Halieaceae bacterium]HCD56468.1 carbon storage regulator [Halieaceae bacterium]